MLRPFFHYFGSKYSLVPYYPKPANGLIIEPFAGSACYACAYPDRRVLLYDLNPIICAVWDYLIKASRQDILDLPIEIDDCVLADLKVPQEARWLIGFWESMARVAPNTAANKSKWMATRPNQYWGVAAKSRIMLQQPFIRHWQVRCWPYEKIKNQNATWFIDPPYEHHTLYPFKVADYAHLGEWCKSRKGDVIVCEGLGADWLDFQILNAGDRDNARNKKPYIEVIWSKRGVK